MITTVNPSDNFGVLLTSHNGNAEAIPTQVVKTGRQHSFRNFVNVPQFLMAETATKNVVLNFGTVTHNIPAQEFTIVDVELVVGENNYALPPIVQTYSYTSAPDLLRWDTIWIDVLGVVHITLGVESKSPQKTPVAGLPIAYILVGHNFAAHYPGQDYLDGQSNNERLAWSGAQYLPRGTQDWTYGFRTTANDGETLPVNQTTIYYLDSLSGSFTLKLKRPLVDGTFIVLKDKGGVASLNNITIDGNGQDIDGNPTLVISTDYSKTMLQYNFINEEWLTL